MKKILCAALAILSPLFSATAPPISTTAHTISIGPQATYFAVKQNGGPGKQEGCIAGGRAEYEYQDKLYANAFIQKSWGTADTYFIQDFWVEGTLGYLLPPWKWVEGKLGKAIPTWARVHLIPYVGIGYQYFKENQHLSDISLATLHPYVPIGFLLNFFPMPLLSVGINAKALVSLLTLAYVGGFSGTYWEVKRKNDLVIELPVKYQWNSSVGVWAFSFVPYYSLVRFGPSIAVNSAGVAANIQSQRLQYIGGRVMFGYAF